MSDEGVLVGSLFPLVLALPALPFAERTKDAFFRLIRHALERQQGIASASNAAVGTRSASGAGIAAGASVSAAEQWACFRGIDEANYGWFAELFVEQILHVALQGGPEEL